MYEKQQKLYEIIINAVEVMEKAAQETTDMETLKTLTVGYHDIKEALNESRTGSTRQKK